MDAELLAFLQGAYPWAEEDGGPLRNFQDLRGQREGASPGQGLAQQQWLNEVDVLRGGSDIFHVDLQGGGDLDNGPAHCGEGRSAQGTPHTPAQGCPCSPSKDVWAG